jgi:hypothetical protein
VSDKRFFRLDDDGLYWLVVANDEAHAIEVMGTAEWELHDGQLVQTARALELGHVSIVELEPLAAARHTRCHTEDERGVIPLVDAAIGDAFCSEW